MLAMLTLMGVLGQGIACHALISGYLGVPLIEPSMLLVGCDGASHGVEQIVHLVG